MPDAHYSDDLVTVYHGDCLAVLAELSDASVDAVCTDPPYGLEFMGKDWDSFRPSSARLRTRQDQRTNPVSGKSTVTTPEAYVAAFPYQRWCQQWATECLRVLKPGGHLLAFGGTRTWHRLACAIEDAGFEIRDTITWLYGSGFPKSLDVSKAIDKARHDRANVLRVTAWIAEQATARQLDELAGTNGMGGHWTSQGAQAAIPTAEAWERLRPLLGEPPEWMAPLIRPAQLPGEAWERREVIGVKKAVPGVAFTTTGPTELNVTAPATDAARQWQGWGTALKPASEPIVIARKPLAGTVAGNVIAFGTGALNIGACRVGPDVDTRRSKGRSPSASSAFPHSDDAWVPHLTHAGSEAGGRWPTNVLLTHADCEQDCAPGCPVAELDAQSGTLGYNPDGVFGVNRRDDNNNGIYGGGRGITQAGRKVFGYGDTGGASRFFPTFRYEAKAPTAERPRDPLTGEAHATVKPLDLMRWLVRLVTPPGGTVLDPFAGSGTTAEACLIEGFRCIAIEREAAYLPLITARLSKPIQPVLFGVSGSADDDFQPRRVSDVPVARGLFDDEESA